MVHDDYLVCTSYANRSSYALYNGFTAFYDETLNNYFFGLLDSKGNVLLRSEGYPNENVRNKGIDSVVKNALLPERFSIIEEDGEFLVILKAGNRKEIARSCPYKTEKEAEKIQKTILGVSFEKPTVVVKKVTVTTKEKSPETVAKKTVVVEEAVAAVKKTVVAVKKEVTPIIEKEIIAERIIAPIIEKTAIVANATTPIVEKIVITTTEITPNFLSEESYFGHSTIEDEFGKTGYALFTGADEKHYFVVYDADGSIFQRSVGFETPEVRDQKYNALKNAILDENSYKVIEIGGQYFTTILGADGNELCRSTPFSSFINAHLKTPQGWNVPSSSVGTIY